MIQRVIGKSVIGATHIKNQLECQDSIGKYVLDDGVYVLVVADGHGSSSCPYSKEGSDRACRAFVDVMKNLYENYNNDLDSLATYLNREGDTSVAMDVCIRWQEKVKSAHYNAHRPMPKTDDGLIQKEKLFRLYGTTLIGLLVTKEFLFALQIGDGDLSFVSDEGFQYVVEAEKILGVEAHSLSKLDAWKKSVTTLRRYERIESPSLFLLSSDGFSNSYIGEDGYENACVDYFNTIKKYGPDAVEGALEGWLTETSEKGCGDDISLVMLYSYDGQASPASVSEEEETDKAASYAAAAEPAAEEAEVEQPAAELAPAEEAQPVTPRKESPCSEVEASESEVTENE